jgi:hypothetical protein
MMMTMTIHYTTSNQGRWQWWRQWRCW